MPARSPRVDPRLLLQFTRGEGGGDQRGQPVAQAELGHPAGDVRQFDAGRVG